jgi:uncharacterized protein YbjT (DUF2867 family)
MSEDRTQGLTYERLNLVSARNAANMCVSDGVPHMVLLSAAGSPWLNRRYVRAKRQAEVYLGRVGLQATVIRAPLVYVRGSARPLLYQLLTLAGQLPLLSWTVLGRVGPLPVDVLARGVARITLAADKTKTIYHARDIRKLVKRHELRQFIPLLAGILAPANAYRPEHPSDATVPNRSRLDSDNRERLS